MIVISTNIDSRRLKQALYNELCNFLYIYIRIKSNRIRLIIKPGIDYLQFTVLAMCCRLALLCRLIKCSRVDVFTLHINYIYIYTLNNAARACG